MPRSSENSTVSPAQLAASRRENFKRIMTATTARDRERAIRAYDKSVREECAYICERHAELIERRWLPPSQWGWSRMVGEQLARIIRRVRSTGIPS